MSAEELLKDNLAERLLSEPKRKRSWNWPTLPRHELKRRETITKWTIKREKHKVEEW